MSEAPANSKDLPVDPRLLPAETSQATSNYGTSSAPAQGAATTSALPPTSYYPAASAPGGIQHILKQEQASPGQYQLVQHDGSHSPTAGSPQDPKRPRACDSCRALKVRCERETIEEVCKRCNRTNKNCFTSPPTRKRTKKSDTKVAELEKKLDALTRAMEQYQNVPGHAEQGDFSRESATFARNASHAGSIGTFAPVSTENTPYSWSAQALSTAPPGEYSSEASPTTKRRRIEEEPQRGASGSVGGSNFPPPAGALLANPSAQSTTTGFRYNCIGDPPADLKTVQKDELAAEWIGKLEPEEIVDYRKVIDGLVDEKTMIDLFTRYTDDLCEHFPAVVFAPGTSAMDVKESKPILLLAIMFASSVEAALTNRLSDALDDIFAQHLVRKPWKSFELVQALQISALWYKPPSNPINSNFYQTIHMCAVMALDLGLGKRFNKARRLAMENTIFKGYCGWPDSDTIECRRAWLVCYYLCSSVSTIMRRPNLIRWTNYMAECVTVLETSSEAFPSDKFLTQHIKLQHICEEIGELFRMDDPSANVAFTDPKIIFAIGVFEKQLKEWSAQIPKEVYSIRLKFMEHVVSLYMHEIAMHVNHNVEDFRAPFTDESLREAGKQTEALTQTQLGALTECLKASQGILETFLNFDERTLNCVPMLLFFVRIGYAVVVLIRLYVAVTTPGNEVGKVIKKEELKIDQYLDQLVTLFTNLAGSNFASPKRKALAVMSKLRRWLNAYIDEQEGKDTDKNGKPPSPPSRMLPQQDAAQQKTQQGYNPGNTPLHLLSEAAIGNQTPRTSDNAGMQNKFPQTNPWFDMGQQPFMPSAESAQFGDANTMDYWGGYGFEHAMNMALSGDIGSDISGLFMGDTMFNINGDLQQQAVPTGAGYQAWM